MGANCCTSHKEEPTDYGQTNIPLPITRIIEDET